MLGIKLPKDWVERKIGEIAHEVSERNSANDDLPVLSCTKYDGLVDSLKYFKRKVFSDDISKYKLVPINHFAYATNHIEEGSIGYQNFYEKALISPIYTVFKTSPEIYDSFLFFLLKTELYRHIFEINTSASVDRRGSLRWKEFSQIKIPLPPVEEQKKIAKILSAWDRAIYTLDKLIDAKTRFKKGLMQKMLTGKTRFKEFKGEKWQTVTLNDCCLILDNKRKPLNEGERNQMRGDIPYYGANGLVDYVNDYIFDDELILMAEDGGYFDEFATRPIAYLISGKSWVNNHAHVLKAKEGFCQHLIFFCLVHKNISKYLNSGTRSKLNRGELEKIEIHVPVNSNEQKRIADVLLSLERTIDVMTSFSKKLKNQKKGLMQKLLTGKLRVEGARQ